MRALAVAVVVAFGACAAGCGGATKNGMPPEPTCNDSVGIALLSWTIHHAVPTADQGCVGVDHIVAELRTDCNDIQIGPIPCISGARWRYDALPAGPQTVTLFAIDDNGRSLARGLGAATLEATVPAQPVPIDLE